MAIAKKDCIADPWGVIPETFSFPLMLNHEQEQRVNEISIDARDIWNQIIEIYEYQLRLYKRALNGTALVSEKTPSPKKGDEGKMIWNSDRSVTFFNYLTKHMRNSFPYVAEREAVLTRGITRKVIDSFESYFALYKKGDIDAKRPNKKYTEMFQTLVYLNKDLRTKGTHAGKLVIEKDFVLPVPDSTLRKIGSRKIASIEISRSESKTYLPGEYSCSLVVWQSAPTPQLLQRSVGVDLGSSGCAIFDSRGRSFYIKMRRPDYYWRPKIALLDKYISAMREAVTVLPKQERRAAWRTLELCPKYRQLCEQRSNIFNKMKNQQHDYHKKLANQIIKYGDIFFVGKSIIRSQEGKLADAKTGNVEKNWNVQNTGSLSEVLRLLQWRAVRAGKIVIETPDIKIDEQDYRLRKVLQARSHLAWGLSSDKFQKEYDTHIQRFQKGFNVLKESGWNNRLVVEIDDIKILQKEFEKNRFNKKHISALLKIAQKVSLTHYKNVSIIV